MTEIWKAMFDAAQSVMRERRISEYVSAGEVGAEALSAMTDFCFSNTELKRLWTEVDIRNIPSQKMPRLHLLSRP